MDDLLAGLYKQRDAAVAHLKRRGVPETDAELLVDKAIEAAIKAQERGKGKQVRSLIWEVAPWYEAYRHHPEMVTWDEMREAHEARQKGRKGPAPRGD